MKNHTNSRRDFLKIAALGLGSLAFRLPARGRLLPDFPDHERLGRVLQKVDLKARPNIDSQTVGVLYDDAVLPWLREAAGQPPYNIYGLFAQRWVETPEGYIYSPYIQPVRNRPNEQLASFRQTSIGNGAWVEVTVPYTDVVLENDPSGNSWVKERITNGLPVRLYYGQIFWVDSTREADGETYYRVNPNYYGGVDKLWVPSRAMRALTDDEIAPLSPDVTEKKVVIDLSRQTLSCYEGSSEVFYCMISSGGKWNAAGQAVDKWSTPVGKHRVSRKFLSLQMSGGVTTGSSYDLPGVGWTSIFVTGGVAIHATVWHNSFGTPVSHGCVNCLPEDAKWIWRWLQPVVPYDPGMVDISLTGDASTTVEVIET